MRNRVELLIALLLEILGAGGALLISTRTWQTVTTPRPRPLPRDVLDLNGRSVDSASTALALVALAGLVAVVATRGLARRLIGIVVALAGVGLVWRAGVASAAIGPARARTLVEQRHRGVSVPAAVRPQVSVHEVWPALSVLAGLLVLVAGLLIALRGHRWSGMSARYSAPAFDRREELERGRARAAVAMWSALDRGDDPTGVPRAAAEGNPGSVSDPPQRW